MWQVRGADRKNMHLSWCIWQCQEKAEAKRHRDFLEREGDGTTVYYVKKKKDDDHFDVV